MVDLLGGFLTAVGGAGAGGFKAAGEVADQNIKDRSDAMKMQAMAERDANLQRLQQTWQSGESAANREFQSGQTDKQIAATGGLHAADREARYDERMDVEKIRSEDRKLAIQQRSDDIARQERQHKETLANRSPKEQIVTKEFIDDTGKVSIIGLKPDGSVVNYSLPEGIQGKSAKTNSAADKRIDEKTIVDSFKLEAAEQERLDMGQGSIAKINKIRAMRGDGPLTEETIPGKKYWYKPNEPDTKRYVEPSSGGLINPGGSTQSDQSELDTPQAQTGMSVSEIANMLRNKRLKK